MFAPKSNESLERRNFCFSVNKLWRQIARPTPMSDCSKRWGEADDLFLQTRNRVGIAEETLEKLPKTEKFNKMVWRN